MNIYLEKRRTRGAYRLLSAFVAVAFACTSIMPPAMSFAQVIPQTILNLPVPGTMVNVSPGFTPTIVKGMTFYPDNPLKFDFIIDTGDENLQGEAFKTTSRKLIKYFLATGKF